MKYIETKYFKWINEAKAPNNEMSEEEITQEVALAKRKVEKCIMWININMGFYAELISHLAIFGTYGHARMFTDCKTYIAYCPHFVATHGDEEIRAVFLHETLHVIAQHNEREGTRDHEVWGKACDLAINPIIKSESRYGKYIKFPTVDIDDGKGGVKTIENVLYEKRFDGMRAEDIYDTLVEEGEKTGEDMSPEDRAAVASGDMGNEDIEPVEGSIVQEQVEEEYVDPDEDIYGNRRPGAGGDEEDDAQGGDEPGDENGNGGEEQNGDIEGQGEPGEGQGEPGEGQGEPGEGQGKPGPGQPGQGKPGPGQPGQGKPGLGQPGQGKPGPGQPGQGKPGPGQPGEGEAAQGEPDGKMVSPIPMFHKSVRKGGIPEGEDGKSMRVSRDNNIGDQLKGDADEWKKRGKSKVLRRKTPNWEYIKQKALATSGGTLSEKTRKLLTTVLGDVAVVNWENELKKWYDHCLSGQETVLPNRRLLGSGFITYATKKTGLSGLKTIVAAVDTSASISEDQKKTFLNEVAYLAKKHNSDKLVIIYCSDDFDGAQVLKKGQKIDLSIMKSTGGNREGFVPPFKWCYENRIKPSVFIYLTDTGGLMPDKETFGINKYMNKVIWFICSTEVHNTPPFGKCIFMPVGSIKKDGKHPPVGRL